MGSRGCASGYALGPEQFVHAVNAVRQPFSVNHLAQVAATEALRHQDDVARRAEWNAAERLWMEEELAELGFDVADSQANFCWVGLGDLDEGDVMAALGRRGRRGPAREGPRRTGLRAGHLRHARRERALHRGARRLPRLGACRRTNLETVRQIYRAWAGGIDSPEPLKLFHPDVEYVNPEGAIEPGTRLGHDGMRQVGRSLATAFSEMSWEVHDLIPSGDKVLALTTFKARRTGQRCARSRFPSSTCGRSATARSRGSDGSTTSPRRGRPRGSEAARVRRVDLHVPTCYKLSSMKERFKSTASTARLAGPQCVRLLLLLAI